MPKFHDFPQILASVNDLSEPQIQDILNFSLKLKNPQFRTEIQKQYKDAELLSIAHLFFENSTRTLYSFYQAAKLLGLNPVNIPVANSSLTKGEAIDETLMTFAAQGFCLSIIRTSDDHFFDKVKKLPIPLLNAGNGQTEHPTQALLDLLTLLDISNGNFESLKNKKIAFVGDLKHSRVAKSHFRLLPKFAMKVIAIAPEEFMVSQNEKEAFASSVEYTQNFHSQIKDLDYLYMLRVQNERHNKDADISFSLDQYIKSYGLKHSDLKENPNLFVFHPGPANIGVEITQEVADSKNYQAYLQVENSTFLRAALIHYAINSFEYSFNPFRNPILKTRKSI
ncbi:MAG: aspartate/ornithine carbamoyltransferase family protein [Bacteriovoracaceae bacterium]